MKKTSKDYDARLVAHIKEAMAEVSREFGRQGGKAAAANMTREQRIARAKKASAAAVAARRKRAKKP
jgi:hypothetical protein